MGYTYLSPTNIKALTTGDASTYSVISHFDDVANPTSPTGALFRTPPVPCDFLVIRALALPSAKLPGYRPQIPRPRRRHLVHEFSGFKFVLQKR